MKTNKLKNNCNNSILEKLEKLRDDNIVSFHVPGHKMGRIFQKMGYKNILQDLYTLDTTEIDGTDNLHDAKDIIKYSQERAARVFNSDKVIYLINGTTCGIEAAIMATCHPKSKLIINRDCHQSVINACILGDIEPIYLQSKICNKTNIVMGVDIEYIKSVIDNNLDSRAIVLTYPTYYGYTYDLEKVCEYAHSKGMIVIIDEAHGAHLQLSNKLPKSAIEQGADIIVQSIHKTLPAFTQSSMMHIKGNRVDEYKIKTMLKFLESSSPSYILLLSLELAVDIYEKYGVKLMEDLINNIENFKTKFLNNENIIIDNKFDKTKIFISLKYLGITGYELDSILRNKYKIQVELANYYGVLLICTIGNNKEDFIKLEQALEDLCLKINKKELTYINYPQNIPTKILNPREAFYSNKRKVKLEYSIGKISGEYIIPYPPGISLISPGEIITQEIIDYVQHGIKNGMTISGIKDINLKYIDVIDIN